MALWNDKRTPPGVVTDTASGQHQTMTGQPAVAMSPRQRLDAAMPDRPGPSPAAKVAKAVKSKLTGAKPH